MLLTETEKAYWAAWIDAEGNIGIRKCYPKNPNWSPQYTLRVSSTNTDSTNIEGLQKLGAYKSLVKPKVGNRKLVYIAELQAGKARDFLIAIKPYLRMKTEDAAIGIRFQELLDRREFPGNARCSPEALAEREELYQKLKRPRGKIAQWPKKSNS